MFCRICSAPNPCPYACPCIAWSNSRKHHVEEFDHIKLGNLKLKFKTKQNFDQIPQQVKDNYECGKFTRIEPNEKITVVILSDNGIPVIKIPAKIVDDTMEQVAALEKWFDEFGCQLPAAKDELRGLHCVHHYACWVKYKGGLVPNISDDYVKDGEISREFMKSSKRLWELSDTHFPDDLKERIHKDLKRYHILEGHRRFCGPWTGCAVNVGTEDRPVQTK
jgi:hypothetical protein